MTNATSERDGVVVAWLFPEEVSGHFAYSLADMIRHDAQGPQHIVGPKGGLISMSTGPRLAEARNQVVDLFATRHPESEWLLMIDSDMTFRPSLVEDMLAVAHPKDVPILSALIFAGGKTADPYPALYKGIEKEANGQKYVGVERVYDYPRDTLVQVQATGGACLLMHRGALGAIGKAYETASNGATNPYRWFVEGGIGPAGEEWGEDISFGIRANAIGVPVHCHTGIKTGHRKTYTLDEAHYDAVRSTRGAMERPPTRAEARAQARQKVA